MCEEAISSVRAVGAVPAGELAESASLLASEEIVGIVHTFGPTAPHPTPSKREAVPILGM